jgi:hypothetical protein
MTSPMSVYSKDAEDFLQDYKESTRKQTHDRLEEHQDVIQAFGEDYERAYQLLNTYYAEAYKDLSYYLGNQWSLEELSYLNNQRRSSFTYNKIRRLINLVQGYQRKNRLATIISPIEDASDDTAAIQTDVMQYVMQHAGGYETISEAFKGALTTGISFVSPWLDYRSDPISGDIRFHHDAWNAVIFDPFMTKKDLSDCSFITRRKFLSRTDIKSLLPDKEEEVERLPYGTRDDKFTYMPYARQWGMQKLLNYNEYWRTKWENKDVLVDMETGETLDWNGDKKRLQLYQRVYPQIKVMRKPVRSVDLGIIVEGQLMYYGKDPNGLNDYPFVPFFAIFEPSYDLYTWKIQSLVRIVRDPQTELNKRRSKMVDILDNQLNSGWIAKTNSVSNPSSLYKTGQGQVIFLKPEAQMTDIQKLNPTEIPSSMFALEAEFEKDIMTIAGVNEELFGMAENDKVETAGILAKMRQAAGLINLQDLFDGLRESQRLLGQKTLTLMQQNYTPEKVKLITKKEPTPEFFSKAFSRYNVVVEEGVLTDTQQESQFLQLSALKAIGVQVPDHMIIQESKLHNKKMMTEYMQKQAEAAQQQQQMAVQQQMQQQAVITDSLGAKAQSDRALAQERINKVGLEAAESAERIQRADEDRTASVLNLVKAIKELETMDINNIMTKVQILKEMQAKETPESGAKAPAA